MTINLEKLLNETIEVELRNGNVVTGKVGKTYGIYYIDGFHRNGMTITYNVNGTSFCLDNPTNQHLHDIMKIKQIKEIKMIDLEDYLGETVEVELRHGDIITGKLRKLENPYLSSRPYYIDRTCGDYGYWTQYGVYNSNLIASHKDIMKIKQIKTLSQPETETMTNVIRSKIDVFTTENERVELTVDDEGIFLTACNGGAREDLSIGSKDIVICVARAILEHYNELK